MKKQFIFLICLILAACAKPAEPAPAPTPATAEENIPATHEETELASSEENEEPEDEPTAREEENVIAYRGELNGMQSLGGIDHLGDGTFIDPAAMGLYTFTYTYDEDGEVFVYYPKSEDTRLEIYTLVYDAARGNLVAKEFPMFEHTMKPDEVFVLLYAYRDEPKIEIVFHHGDESATWRPMDMENMNLPEEIGKLAP